MPASSTKASVPDDLSPTEQAALELIRERGSVFQSQLWKELDVSSRTGSRVSQSLSDRGLIDRTEAKNNGRKTYELTLSQSSQRESKTTRTPALDFEEVSDGAESIARLLEQRDEVPLQKIDRRIDEPPSKVDEFLEELLSEELITIERVNMYGRERDIVSLT